MKRHQLLLLFGFVVGAAATTPEIAAAQSSDNILLACLGSSCRETIERELQAIDGLKGQPVVYSARLGNMALLLHRAALSATDDVDTEAIAQAFLLLSDNAIEPEQQSAMEDIAHLILSGETLPKSFPKPKPVSPS